MAHYHDKVHIKECQGSIRLEYGHGVHLRASQEPYIPRYHRKLTEAYHPVYVIHTNRNHIFLSNDQSAFDTSHLVFLHSEMGLRVSFLVLYLYVLNRSCAENICLHMTK